MTTETVLITGASSGIGRELARCFAASRSSLVLVARREDRLRELAQELVTRYAIKASVIVKDLSRTTAAQEIADELERTGIVIDVLVNNAGFGDRGEFASLGLEHQMDMAHVDVMAVTELTRRLLPAMVGRRKGGILNVSSTAAFQPGPLMSVYYASKAYVLHFSEGLVEELAGTGVTVSCLCPGPTATEFGTVAHLEGTLLANMGVMSAAKVAQAGYEGFRAGKAIVIPGLRNKLVAISVRFSPRAVVRKMVKALHQ